MTDNTDHPRSLADQDTDRSPVWILGALRACLFGHTECRALNLSLRRRLGVHADLFWADVVCWVRLAAFDGRRRLRLAPPSWPEPTSDERAVLSLFTAAATGDVALVDAKATILLGRPPRTAFTTLTLSLAAMLQGESLESARTASPMGFPASWEGRTTPDDPWARATHAEKGGLH